MEQLRKLLADARAAFTRLTQREQFLVLSAAAGVVLLVLIILGLWVGVAISNAESRVKIKNDQLAQVLQLQGDYRAKKAEREVRLRELSRADVRLVSLIEDTARQAGVEIGQLKPEEGAPSPDGVIESSVSLRASNLSIDRLQDFLNRIERSAGIVVVKRLKMEKPYRKDSIDVDLTVVTFKAKS